MSSAPEPSFELTAAIRLSKKSDGLGIPVFSLRPSNSMYVPETDTKLRITNFESYADDSLLIVPLQSPTTDYPQFYRVGDAVPIPVWKNDQAHVIISSWSWSKISAELGADSSVAQRLAKTLKKADGKPELERDKAHQFFEFLSVKPTADRYWVDQFRDNLMQIASLDRSSERNLLPEYGRLALDWAHQCAPKADVKAITHFVDGLSNYRQNHQDFLEAQGLALMRQIVRKPSSSRQLARLIDDVARTSKSLSVIDAVMSSNRRSKYFEETYWSLRKNFQQALLGGKRNEIESYGRLFGRSKNLPSEIADAAYALLRFKIEEVLRASNAVFGSTSNEQSPYVLQSIARSALEDAGLVEALHKLIHPDDENEDVFRVNWTGFGRDTIKDLEVAAKGQLP